MFKSIKVSGTHANYGGVYFSAKYTKIVIVVAALTGTILGFMIGIAI